MNALVVLNPYARGGTATERYRPFRKVVEERFDTQYAFLDDDWYADLAHVDRVIAVGGDGTVNAVANAVVAFGGPTLGAIGLGSSNDFHKPLRQRGVSLLLGPPQKRAGGRATWEDEHGERHTRWFFVSASLGLTARANRVFATHGWNRWSVSGAIAHAALASLVRHRNIGARIDGARAELSNLNVMLTRHLAGGLSFASAVSDGHFAVHRATGLTRAGLLRRMAQLFAGRLECETQREVEVELDEPDDLELDGEVFRARQIAFSAVPSLLEVCT